MSYWDHREPRPVDVLVGACMIVRRKAIEEVGLLDEDFFLFGEDVEWCYRLRQAGWILYYLSDVEITHVGGQSTKHMEVDVHIHALRSMNLFFQKHYGYWYARIHRAMIGVLSLAKLAVYWARLITSRELDANAIRTIRTRIHAHKCIVRWAILGQS